MKKLLLTITILMFATAALAVPFDETPWVDAGYEKSGSFFSLTDFTTSNALFSLTLEQASYNSSFGIFSVDDVSNPTLGETLQVFAASDEPPLNAMLPPTQTSVDFRNVAGDWQASTDGFVTFKSFGTTFGFYYGVYTDGVNTDGVEDPDYTFYSYSNFNTIEKDVEHILTYYNSGLKQVAIFLDDQLDGTPRDYDYTDMTVMASDVAPVPEPGTLLLLGSGLIGLAYLKRRKS